MCENFVDPINSNMFSFIATWKSNGKRTNLVSYKKKNHHLQEYQYLIYWFWSNLLSPLHLLDNFLNVPNCPHLQILMHTKLDMHLTWIHHKLCGLAPTASREQYVYVNSIEYNSNRVTIHPCYCSCRVTIHAELLFKLCGQTVLLFTAWSNPIFNRPVIVYDIDMRVSLTIHSLVSNKRILQQNNFERNGNTNVKGKTTPKNFI